jgi:hypothetical protein
MRVNYTENLPGYLVAVLLEMVHSRWNLVTKLGMLLFGLFFRDLGLNEPSRNSSAEGI